MLNGLFDIDNRLDYLTENGDMLPRLKELVPWEKFRRDLEVIYDHERKSNAGRRPFDVGTSLRIRFLFDRGVAPLVFKKKRILAALRGTSHRLTDLFTKENLLT